ncbi:MAG: TatD family hydrolase [Candidatus Rokubacteria bacterium]|nr:TatD family hydrolase [Candidatus Rokubacteria bacterium]
MIVDSHCHLHDAAFSDVRTALSRALESDVWGVVAVGCDPRSNERTLETVSANGKAVWPALGFHPEWAHLTDEDLARVEAQVIANHSRLVALGEVGLPWYNLVRAADAASLMARGRARLGRLLALATRFDLPAVVHAPHGAAVGALEALKAAGVERAVFHWHKAPREVTRAILDAGYLVSVTPEVVYRQRDRELVEWVPLDSLLVERSSRPSPPGPGSPRAWPRRWPRSSDCPSRTPCTGSPSIPASSSTSSGPRPPLRRARSLRWLCRSSPPPPLASGPA